MSETGKLLLLRSPAALEAFLASTRPTIAATVPERLRASIRLAIAEEEECARCLEAAAAIARAYGMDEDEIDEARLGLARDPAVELVLSFVHDLIDGGGQVFGHQIADLRDVGFGDAQIVEIAVTVALARFHASFQHDAGVAATLDRPAHALATTKRAGVA